MAAVIGGHQLPEVESARALIEQFLAGRLITHASAAIDDIVFDGTPGADIARHLVGAKVIRAKRRGKYFWIELDRRPWPLFHFGMTGEGHVAGVTGPKYRVQASQVRDAAVWPPKFLKLELHLEGGLKWAYSDARRLGRIRLVQDPASEPPVSLLGFDPLLDMPDDQGFKRFIASRRAPIKAVLLDQSVAAGVGNWIADEVLYQSGIHPAHPASALSESALKSLRQALHTVVTTAVSCKTKHTDFPSEWLFHHRWSKRERCPKDAFGQQITFVTVGGRTSAVVPQRQKLSGAVLKIAATPPSAGATVSTAIKATKTTSPAKSKGPREKAIVVANPPKRPLAAGKVALRRALPRIKAASPTVQPGFGARSAAGAKNTRRQLASISEKNGAVKLVASPSGNLRRTVANGPGPDSSAKRAVRLERGIQRRTDSKTVQLRKAASRRGSKNVSK